MKTFTLVETKAQFSQHEGSVPAALSSAALKVIKAEAVAAKQARFVEVLSK